MAEAALNYWTASVALVRRYQQWVHSWGTEVAGALKWQGSLQSKWMVEGCERTTRVCKQEACYTVRFALTD